MSVAGGEPAEQQDISSAFVTCLDSLHQKSQRTDLGLSSSIKASLAKHVYLNRYHKLTCRL